MLSSMGDTMKKTQKLGDKYLVLKKDDICGRLTEYGQRQLNQLVDDINSDRKQDGKNIQKYVVLNLDDEIDLEQLMFSIQKKYCKLGIPGLYKPKVEKFAIDLVNAIFKAKKT